MQFEDFDKKVREAAEHHHPAYDEKAWKNMENMLDKHLPVEKDNKRRIIFFLLIFLLAGTGAYLWFSRQNKPASFSDSSQQAIEQSVQPGTVADEKTNPSAPTNAVENPKEDLTTTPAKEIETSDRETVANSSTQQESSNNISTIKQKTNSQLLSSKRKSITEEIFNSIKLGHTIIPPREKKKTKNISNTAQPDNQKVSSPLSSITNNDPASEQPGVNDTQNSQATSSTANNNTDLTIVNKQQPDTAKNTVEEVTAKAADKKPEAQKPAKKKNRSVFAITVSGGPDISTVGIKSIGKMNCVIGAGLSYTYNRFTLRSGFYAVRKIYSAGPDDYKPPKHYWTNYVDLTKVDANCRVFEIPITLGYNFVQKDDHSIFAAVGVSSYLMRKETYEYYYKDQTGVDRQRSWSTQDNNNGFSILNLSAGYEKKLARNLSLTAEPYLKVPLDGVGFGNIQMNSMGVLITMNIKPFLKK